MIRKRKFLEEDIQEAFFGWLSLYYLVRKLSFAIPNGGKRNIVEAKRFKKQGVTSGVPDIFLAIPYNNYHGLFIELKAEKGRLSDIQKEWLKNLNDKGYKAVVCYSLDEAINTVTEYFGGNLSNVK